MAWTEVYLRTNWYLDPSSRLATTDMGRKLGAMFDVYCLPGCITCHVMPPRLCTNFCERVFSHAGLAAWNALTDDLCTVVDPAKFSKQVPCPCSPMVKPLGRQRDVRSGRGSIRASARARPPTKKELFQIIPMHMMTREIIRAGKQRARRCPL